MAEDPELEALRRRRLEQLRQQQEAATFGGYDPQSEMIAQQQAEQERAMREQLMRQILTPEARDRLERLRLARPQDASRLESQLIQLAQSGRLGGKIDDDQLRQILARLQPEGRDINIRRK